MVPSAMCHRGFAGAAGQVTNPLILDAARGPHPVVPQYVVMCKPGLAPHRVDLGDAIERATKAGRGE